MPEAHSCGCLPRIYGCYEHLWAGQVADALVDLTGGLAERWNLKDVARTSGQQAGPGGSEHRTCRQLLSLKDRCLISCSVLSPRAGKAGAGATGLFSGSPQSQGETRRLSCAAGVWRATFPCHASSRGRLPLSLDLLSFLPNSPVG